jgi:hypothetical protein
MVKAPTDIKWLPLAVTLKHLTDLFGSPQHAKRGLYANLMTGGWRWRWRDALGVLHGHEELSLEQRQALRFVYAENWAYEWTPGGSDYRKDRSRRLEVYGIEVGLNIYRGQPEHLTSPIPVLIPVQPEPELAPLPPTKPGHPMSPAKPLVIGEAKRQIATGGRPQRLKQFAIDLQGWLAAVHPDLADDVKLRTIEAWVRPFWKKLASK